MQSHSASFWSTHKRTILGLVFGLAFSATLAYAVPPSTQYGAGATLDPACAPGGTNCTVDIDGPINFVGTSYVGTTSGPGGDGSSGAGGHNIFLGEGAGDGASSSNHSNFFGEAAGFGSTAASNSNFLGLSAGSLAPNAQRSNFLGLSAGANATNAAHSNFLGNLAGSAATNASNSNFFGQDAGNGATNAANAIFIGRSAGINDTVNNTVSDLSSILIGQYTNTGGFSNSIILGSGTSVSAISNTKANQFMLAPTITEARWRGVDYTFPSAQAAGAGYVLTNNGSGVLSWTTAGSGGSTTLQTNGVTNGSQALLNLIEGTNIDITDNGTGGVTIDASIPSVDTIYTDDGTLSGSRTIDLAGNDLNFVDSGSGNKVGIYIDAGGTISNFGSDPIEGVAYIQVDNSNDRITLQATTLNIPTGATDGYVLTSDGSGNATWQTPTEVPITRQNSTSLFSTGLTGTGDNSTATHSLFLLEDAGNAATNAANSIFIGQDAGNAATNAANSIFIGQNAGTGTTITTTGNANDYSILIGKDSSNGNFKNSVAIGLGATNTATDQLVIGSATRSFDSIFIGGGQGTASTTSTVLIGKNAGANVSTGVFATFVGFGTGSGATSAQGATMFGYAAGAFTQNIEGSVMVGSNAGIINDNGSSDSSNSVFIGTQAGANFNGVGSLNFARSILVGYAAGYTAADNALDNTGDANDYSILIGNESSTGGFSNSIALGHKATNTASNQFVIGSTTRPIDSTVFYGTGGTSCTITTGTSMSCSSDERLKTNIEDLDTDTLSKLLSVRTVSYNWNTNPNGNQMIGFLAQDLQSYFPQLVSTGPNDFLQVNYAGITPILVEAIREMNLKITDIGDLTKDNSWRTALLNWFASATNGIGDFFSKKIHTDTLCVKKSDGTELCLDGDQLERALGSGTTVIITPGPEQTPDSTPEPTDQPAPQEGTEEAPVVDPVPDTAPETPAPEPIPAEPANPEISTPQ